MQNSRLPKRRVVVIGAQSPSRTASFAALLDEAIARHGWAERIETLCCGIGSGVGPVDLRRLEAEGLAQSEGLLHSCPDIEDELDKVEESDVFVVATSDELDELLTWAQSDGKQIFALSEFLGDEGWAIVDPSAPLSEYVGQAREGVSLLLRALVAGSK